MKVFVAIILALVVGASAAPAEHNNTYEGCLKQMNELTKDYVPTEGMSRLLNKIESVLDLNKVFELHLGKNSDMITDGLLYAVHVKDDVTCKHLYTEVLPKIKEHTTCLSNIDWITQGPVPDVMAGSFGVFAKSVHACALTMNVDYPDEYDV